MPGTEAVAVRRCVLRLLSTVGGSNAETEVTRGCRDCWRLSHEAVEVREVLIRGLQKVARMLELWT